MTGTRPAFRRLVVSQVATVVDERILGLAGRVSNPSRIARSIARVVWAHRVIALDGAPVYPSEVVVAISGSLLAAQGHRLAEAERRLARQAAELTAKRDRLVEVPPLSVRFVADGTVRSGFRVFRVNDDHPVHRSTEWRDVASAVWAADDLAIGFALDRGGNLPVVAYTEFGRGVDGIGRIFGDPLLSRVHFAAEPTVDGVRVTDLGSQAGTFVNGARVTSVECRVGDVVLAGGTRLTVVGSGSARGRTVRDETLHTVVAPEEPVATVFHLAATPAGWDLLEEFGRLARSFPGKVDDPRLADARWTRDVVAAGHDVSPEVVQAALLAVRRLLQT